MYDTVRFWLEWSIVGNYRLSTIEEKLTNISRYEKLDRKYVSGNIGNLKVWITENGISIQGSLPKFMVGTNLHTLSRNEIRLAILKLSDYLRLPLEKAKITRIDIGTHISLKYTPKKYYRYLGEKNYFTRNLGSKTNLYYTTKIKQLEFYDKNKEIRSLDIDLVQEYLQDNMMRYELQCRDHLNYVFKHDEILIGSTLFSETFYVKAINLWYNEYSSIEKINNLSARNLNHIKTAKDGKDYILGVLLNSIDYEVIESFISDMKAKNVYVDPKYYSRLKSELRSCKNKPEIIKRSMLITELDGKILEAKNKFLYLI